MIDYSPPLRRVSAGGTALDGDRNDRRSHRVTSACSRRARTCSAVLLSVLRCRGSHLPTWDPPIPPEDLDPAIPRPVPARGRFLSRPGLRIHEGSQASLGCPRVISKTGTPRASLGGGAGRSLWSPATCGFPGRGALATCSGALRTCMAGGGGEVIIVADARNAICARAPAQHA